MRQFFDLMIPRARLTKSLRILVTVNAALVFVMGMFGPFYAVFVERIGGDLSLTGLSWALFAITAGILMLFFSRWELRVKEQELLLSLGYFLISGAFVSFAFMNNIPQLILTQLLLGLGVAITTPVFDSIYTAHTTKEEAVAQWGGRDGTSAIASGVAALVAGILIQALGYATIFTLMAVITAFLGVYIWRLPREIL